MVLARVRTRMRVSVFVHVKVLARREAVTRLAGWPKIQALVRGHVGVKIADKDCASHLQVSSAVKTPDSM
jgi:hypothetical protein